MAPAPEALSGRRMLLVDNRPEYVRSHRLPWLRAAVRAGLEVHVTTISPGELAFLDGEGVKSHRLPVVPGGNELREGISRVRALRSLYRELAPDLVHHVTIRVVVYGSLASTGLAQPRFVNSITGLGYLFSVDSLKVRTARCSLLRLLRWADRRRNAVYVFQNPDDEFLFQRQGVTGRSTHVILGSGVNLDSFPVMEETPGELKVVLPTRMLWEKGVEEFVEAARLLRAKGIAARFILVGGVDQDNPGGIPPAQLTEWTEMGLIEWWGHVTDMAGVFRQCHLVCLPSRYREGVPRVLIEAAASGRPIITTDTPGCREIVRSGENGFLVPAGDSATVASALEALLGDRTLRRRMGTAGRRIVEQEFSEERVVSAYLDIYRQAMSDA